MIELLHAAAINIPYDHPMLIELEKLWISLNL
jgi:hypothetical protein